MIKKIKKKKNSLISLILISILFSTSIGYSIWKDTQTIVGNIKVAYKEPPLDKVTIVPNSKGEYTQKATENATINALSYNTSSVTNTEDILEIYGEYEKYNSWIVAKRTVNISFNFTNNNSSSLALVSSEILENTLDYTVTLSAPSTISSNETVSISISFVVPAHGYVNDGKVRCKFAYKIGEITKYIYYTINVV